MKDYENTDENGIKLTVKDGNISLRQGGKSRNLGVVVGDGQGRYVWTKHEKKENIFRANNSLSIPYEVFRILPEKCIIKFIIEGRVYTITKKYIESYKEDHNVFLYFKKIGYEKKMYIPLEEWDCEGIF
jgi:hypothetical protein